MMRQITFTLFLIFSCSLWAQSNPLKLTMKEAEELFRTHNLLLVAEYYNLSSTYKCNFLGADNKQ